jgi:hypothetical protein
MNVKRRHKYKGSITLKNQKLNENIKLRRPKVIRNTRTYHRLQNGGYHQQNIIGGGGKTDEEKAKEKADKEQKEQEKLDEKKRKEDEKRLLKEEAEKEKQRKKDEADAEKKRLKDTKEAAKIKAKAEKDKPKEDKSKQVLAANQAAPAEGQALKIVTGKAQETTIPETSTDGPVATIEPEKQAEPKPEKKEGWMKQTLKKTGAAIKNIAWGDENTGKLRKAAKLLVSPITLPGTALAKTLKNVYKGTKYAKTKIGIGISKLPDYVEPLRLVKKYKTWRTTSKAATGELKKQKYEQELNEKNAEIEKYSGMIMELDAIPENQRTPEQKQELKNLKSKLNSANSKLDYISIKNAEWMTKSAKSTSKLNKLQASRILPSNKKELDRNIQSQQKAFETLMKEKTNEKKNKTDDKIAKLTSDPNSDPNFTKTLNARTAELDTQLQTDLNGKTGDVAAKINADFAAKKGALKETLINEQKTKLLQEADKEIDLERRKLQLEAYNSQIKGISTKLGINIAVDNPQLQALIAEHHDKPGAKPLTGEELIKKVSEVGFTNIVSSKQAMKQATKYLSAPQAVFKPGQEKAAVNNLGNNSAKRSFYIDYVKDATANLNAKLTDPATAGTNKVKLAKLKGQLDVMNADKRFKGATKDEYLYNLFKSNEALLGITGTTTRVADANKVKQAILTNPATLKAAAEAYYNARTKGMSSEGLKRLAAIYNPALKKYLSGSAQLASVINNLVADGLQNYKYHISNLMKTNPLALKAEDPETYDKIIAAQQSRPSPSTSPSTTLSVPAPANQQGNPNESEA